ncbi:DUF1223 domain-containing protein [Oxalobacteraceae bacterium]|nr:DUF1223 domain-containing protein [Oxalobacteraceae bacterium]
MKHLILSLLGAAALNISPALAAKACSLSSPAYRLALLELYTSEGCSSCPPADQFLSGLRAAGVKPEQAVLLSLHVDYWNYIGWKDPYSRAAFSERQRWLSELAHTRTIYTPEIFVAGQELRGGVAGWRGAVPAAVARINALPAQAQIHIALGQPGPAGLPVNVQASAAHGGTLHIALVQSGLTNKVAAGENSGRVLRHDHVVREWLAPVVLGADSKGGSAATVTRTLPLPPGAAWGAAPAGAAGVAPLAVQGAFGISAFVQSAKGEVLQALSLPVCGG